MLRYWEVDVFTERPYFGNPLAVVLGGDDLDTETMQRFANWTNFSETTFVLAPTERSADYRVRIFTPTLELPFAGHPTLGSAHVWLESGGQPQQSGQIVQECGAGLVPIRHDNGRLAFAAPPLIRSGPVEPELLARIAMVLDVEPSEILDSAWVDNGPGWVAVRLASVARVLELRPVGCDFDLGVVALHDPTGGTAESPTIEVRAFFPNGGITVEDPVTGSLNASLAQWLLGNGTLSAPYVAAQGTALGRAGRAWIESEPDPSGDQATIWVGGGVVTCVRGEVALP